jgi:hypothetical protein
MEKNPALDLGLDDGAVDVIGKVGVRREHIKVQTFLGVYPKSGALEEGIGQTFEL